jgi:hypothetical protein
MTVFVYVDTNKQVGDKGHIKVLANQTRRGSRKTASQTAQSLPKAETSRPGIRN